MDRGPPMVGAEPSRRGGKQIREAEAKEGEECVEEEGLGETEVEATLEGSPEASEAQNLAPSNKPLVSQAKPNFLKMMEQMSQLMGNLTQAVAPRDTSRASPFKTPSMKAPDSFDGTKAYKLRGFIQYFQLIFHNDPENFFSDRKKVLYSTSFLTGRAGKWIEPYLSNISNEDPSYLLNNCQLLETQLFTLFGDPNEIRKAEKELENLRMRERDSPKGEDLVWSYNFLYLSNTIIDWKNGLITYDSSGIISFTINDFATAVNSVSLGGEIKTPSLPPSVHMPSIILSQ
ncbi:hypothetical protein O181_014698 [Austropuccinia psidii MF-1]|uniref:DUF4939 domain-containing protein n=1 Tax=Austropuccinia psidii MF-1 TaxID=1389203 RepID=A0A9Q3GP96_9BASI|nr:hypothetical protein [Austropuccinia psidii MF-1]